MTKEEDLDKEMAEIKKFVDSKGEEGSEDGSSAHDKVEEDQEVEDKEEVAEEAEDSEASEDAEEKEEEETDEEEEPEAKVDPLDQKTADELKKIVTDQQYYEARRGEEIGSLRREIEMLKTPAAVEEEFSEDDIVDADLIEKVIDRREKRKAQEADLLSKEEFTSNYRANEAMFDSLKTKNPDLMELIEPILTKKVRDLGATEQEQFAEMSKSPTWIASAYQDILADLLQEKTQAGDDKAQETEKLSKRKKSASTATGRTVNKKVNQKSVSDMNVDEYKEYLLDTTPEIFEKGR